MARPKKSPTDLRTDTIAFCVSPSEHARLLELCEQAEMSRADYLRACALGNKITVQKSTLPDFITRNDLRRIGVNLNQIAKSINARKDSPIPSLEGVIDQLETLFDKWLNHGSKNS